jgi:hypothetical protein
MRAYGELNLTESSPSQTFLEPIFRDQFKDYKRMSNILQDDVIDLMITASRSVAERECGIDLVRKQYDLSMDWLLDYQNVNEAAYPQRYTTPWLLGSDNSIRLRKPLTSVDLFRITDSNGNVTTLTEGRTGDYMVDLARGCVLPPYGKSWPSYTPDSSSSVLIRFTSGYATDHPFWSNAGARIQMGMMMLITNWFTNRGSFDNVLRGEVAEFPFGVREMFRLNNPVLP